jgi:hypothetical protein
LSFYKIILCTFSCFCVFIIKAQITSQFKIEDDHIKKVFFAAKQVSKVNLKTHQSDVFQFNSSAEGSYKNDIYFDYEVKDDVLYIKSIYPERLAFGDNKMTSMQAFSVAVTLSLPKNLTVEIESEMASIEGSGQYKNLIINTKSGHCQLVNLRGNAIINTYDGNIVITTRQAKIEAKSQNGLLDIQQALIKKHVVVLRSVNGNIKVMQTD